MDNPVSADTYKVSDVSPTNKIAATEVLLAYNNSLQVMNVSANDWRLDFEKDIGCISDENWTDKTDYYPAVYNELQTNRTADGAAYDIAAALTRTTNVLESTGDKAQDQKIKANGTDNEVFRNF